MYTQRTVYIAMLIFNLLPIKPIMWSQLKAVHCVTVIINNILQISLLPLLPHLYIPVIEQNFSTEGVGYE